MKINIIIPAGGDGIRFRESRFKELKPFIKFHGKTMFEHIINGFWTTKYDVSISIIIRNEFKNKYIKDIKIIEDRYSNVNFYYIDNKTNGTTETALLFPKLFNNTPVLLCNCDQIIDINLDEFLDYSLKSDGCILCFGEEKSNKWSFCLLDINNKIEKVVAKQVVSNIAVSGWYFWKKGKDFYKYGLKQVEENVTVNGEFYLCPVFNFAIFENKNIYAYIIDKEKMHGIGTPEDLEKYIQK